MLHQMPKWMSRWLLLLGLALPASFANANIVQNGDFSDVSDPTAGWWGDLSVVTGGMLSIGNGDFIYHEPINFSFQENTPPGWYKFSFDSLGVGKLYLYKDVGAGYFDYGLCLSQPSAGCQAYGDGLDIFAGQHTYYFKVDGPATVDSNWNDWAKIGFTGGNGFKVDNVSVVTAVPEPETYAMLLVGLGVLGFTGRRRMKRLA